MGRIRDGGGRHVASWSSRLSHKAGNFRGSGGCNLPQLYRHRFSHSTQTIRFIRALQQLERASRPAFRGVSMSAFSDFPPVLLRFAFFDSRRKQRSRRMYTYTVAGKDPAVSFVFTRSGTFGEHASRLRPSDRRARPCAGDRPFPVSCVRRRRLFRGQGSGPSKPGRASASRHDSPSLCCIHSKSGSR